MNSKQRAALRSIASHMDAIFQVGKGGINENMTKAIADALEARELVKISVLENSAEDVKSAAKQLAGGTNAALVSVIGRKIVLYKQAEKEENRRISLEIEG